MIANKWLIFILIGIILAYRYLGNSMRNKRRCIMAVTILLTCFSGFRSWQMGDVFHYYYAFNGANSAEWQLQAIGQGDTVGLQLLFRLIGTLGLDFQVCLFLVAAFVAISLGILVYRYSPSPFWSYLIYLAMGFYIFTFSGLKQAIAMGFIIFAMMALIEHKPFKFVLWVAVAMLFHVPALAFLVAYPFANKKIDSLYFVIIGVMIAAVALFRDEIVNEVTQLYYEEELTFEATEVMGFKVIFMILIMAMALILRPIYRYDILYRQVFNIMICAAVVQTFSVYDNVFTRLADYFYQFVVLFVPLMLEPGREQARQFPQYRSWIRYWSKRTLGLIQICVAAFSLWYYFQQLEGSYALLRSFKFFWEA